jgi:cell division protein FtsI/penicillin-binding protein 2
MSKPTKILVMSIMSLFGVLLLGAAPSKPAETAAATEPLAGVSLAAMRFDGEAYRQAFEDGRVATFTVVPELQRHADRLFARNQVPAGAAVILNSRTGRVLTLSQHRERRWAADSPAVALDPSPPAASLFKIVTAAALLEQGDVELGTRTCYHGGGQRLMEHNLVDSKRDDTACASLGAAFGRSINAIFAKLSDRRLAPGVLGRYAERFGFNRELPFDVALPSSTAEIPTDRLERARTAAGFWHTHLSPLHAAMIAQSVAQRGAMLRPYVVDRITDSDGRTIHEGSPRYLGHAVGKETAGELLEAMAQTVKRGTARKAFRDRRGVPLVPGVEIGGKTGTLHGHKPFRAYSWFVGVAPLERPEVAIAVLVVNEPKWRIKSAGTAAELLRKYFELKK